MRGCLERLATVRVCVGYKTNCRLGKDMLWALSRQAVSHLSRKNRWDVEDIIEAVGIVHKVCALKACPHLQAQGKRKPTADSMSIFCTGCGETIMRSQSVASEYLREIVKDSFDSLVATMQVCPVCNTFGTIIICSAAAREGVLRVNPDQYLVTPKEHSAGFVTISAEGKTYCSCPSWRFQRKPAKERVCHHLVFFESVGGEHI
jgi:hypothetical protein